MTVEQMCCTREQSKRLRELGIDQKSYFYHTIVHVTHLPYVPIGETWDKDLIGSAWTVGELGIMLPIMFWDCMNYKFSDGWEIHYSDAVPAVELSYFETEAEARATMLIYLLEKEFITIEEVNKRLHE